MNKRQRKKQKTMLWKHRRKSIRKFGGYHDKFFGWVRVIKVTYKPPTGSTICFDIESRPIVGNVRTLDRKWTVETGDFEIDWSDEVVDIVTENIMKDWKVEINNENKDRI